MKLAAEVGGGIGTLLSYPLYWIQTWWTRKDYSPINSPHTDRSSRSELDEEILLGSPQDRASVESLTSSTRMFQQLSIAQQSDAKSLRPSESKVSDLEQGVVSKKDKDLESAPQRIVRVIFNKVSSLLFSSGQREAGEYQQIDGDVSVSIPSASNWG